MGIVKIIKRCFAHWHRVPREKVPKWVRGKLYKQKYVQDRGREYKKIVIKKTKTWKEITPDDAHWQLNPQPTEFYKTWKKHKFYYRKI